METFVMNTWKIILPVAATLLIAGQAAAQSEEEKRVQAEAAEMHVEAEAAEMRDVQAREVEVERRMVDAERRMADAARQMVEMTAERLPKMAEMERSFEFISDDRPRLGVTIGGESDGPVAGVPILAVTPGSAADDAGLRAGDIITAVNDESLDASDSESASERLLDFMRGVEAGDTLELEYERDGKSGKVEVEPKPVSAQVFAFSTGGRGLRMPAVPNIAVMSGPPGAPGVVDGPSRFAFEWHSNAWGDMELVELNKGLGKYFGTDQGLLVVNAPEADSWQLEDGDVIQTIDGREPTSVRHALRILGSYQSGESLKIEIMRDKKRRTLDIAMPDDLSSRVVPDVAPVVLPARAPLPSRVASPVTRVERT
jgi:C-terminal processing protease CtpA/Prc